MHVYGDGEQTRDFVYVEDVVAAFEAVLRSPAQTQGQTFNVGTGKRTSVNALYQALARQMGVERPPKYLPPKPGELRHNALEWQRLHAATGWYPRTALAEGLAKTLQHFQQQPTPRKS